MSMYALCADVRHFNQCRRCRRNPDRPEHQARLQSAENRRAANHVRPLTSTTACASQIEAPARSRRQPDRGASQIEAPAIDQESAA